LIHEVLKILRVYENTCFGDVMFKSCQYVTNHIKTFTRLINVRLKITQVGYKKPLPRPKSMGKGSKCANILLLKMGCYIKNLKLI
jgi:hypothetical protein